MNQEKLNEIVRLHGLWLRDEEGGVRAELSETGLSKVDLSEADLRLTNLRSVDLRGARLRWANLRGAALSGADLRWVNLHNADLRNADLRNADLRWANLRGADLREADLRNARLFEADLSDADLNEASGAPPYYSVSWSGHGEAGRRLHAVLVDGALQFSCGCFSGDEDELRQYIEDDEEVYKQSRLKALEIILELARPEGVK